MTLLQLGFLGEINSGFPMGKRPNQDTPSLHPEAGRTW